MLVVPFPAGGGNDALARVVAEKMSRALGQQVVVENRGGAGGTIATRAVAKGTPDGYTILLTYTGTLYISIRRSIPMPATIRARTSPRSG
jgi:tripartite-type tricarboxylate transporter receptor subunit TctC